MLEEHSREPSLGFARVAFPNAALRLVGQGGEFAAFLLFARRLGPSAFGGLSAAFLVCRFAGLLGDWGASVFGARLVATGQHDRVCALVLRRWMVTGALGVVLAIGLLAFRGPAALPLVVTLIARGCVLDWVALGRQDGARAAAPASLQGACCVLGALFVTTEAGGALVLAVGYGAGLILSLSLNRAYLREHIMKPKTPAPSGTWTVVFVLADQVCASSDILLLNMLAGSRDAGTYAALYRFPNAILSIGGLLIAGLVPGAVRAVRAGDAARLRRRGRRIGLGLSGVAVLALAPAYALVGPVLGAAYLPGRQALVLLMLSVAVASLAWGVQPLYLAAGAVRPLAKWAALVAVINVAANLVLIPVFGLVGAAGATLAAQILMAGFYLLRPVHVSHRTPDMVLAR